MPRREAHPKGVGHSRGCQESHRPNVQRPNEYMPVGPLSGPGGLCGDKQSWHHRRRKQCKGCWCWTHTSHQPTPPNSSEPTARVKAGSEVGGPGTKAAVMMFIMKNITSSKCDARERQSLHPVTSTLGCMSDSPSSPEWGRGGYALTGLLSRPFDTSSGK